MSVSEFPNPIDLAAEPAFRLGNLQVSPSTREVVGEREREILEPRVMQVLVTLARKRGQVVSRDHLIKECWGGRVVGEDAINRCIAKVRRLSEVHDGFAIETITRVGYRVTEDAVPASDSNSTPAPALQSPPSPVESKVAATNDDSAAPPNEITHQKLRFPKWGYIASGVVLLALIIGLGLWNRDVLVVKRDPSIVVLPFANLSDDPKREYFARGIASETIDILAQLPGMKVIGRNAAFAFGPDADARKVGQELNVAHVLSGTVLENGDRIRISAQLVAADTGATLWSGAFEQSRDIKELFNAQRQLAERVATAMSIALDVAARERLAGAGTKSLEAYDLYLRALQLWTQEGRPREASELIARATEIDPDYAEAWALGGAAYWFLAWGADSSTQVRDYLAQGLKSTQRGVQLNPNNSMTQTAYGAYLAAQPNAKWAEGEAGTHRGLEISRNFRTTGDTGHFMFRTGRLNKYYELSLQLRVFSPLPTNRPEPEMANLLATLNRPSEALELLIRTGAHDSRNASTLNAVIRAQIHAGEKPAAIRKTLESIAQRTQGNSAVFARSILDVFEDPAKARAMLKKWHEDENFQYIYKLDLLPALAAWYGDTDLVLRVWQADFSITPFRTSAVWGPAFAPARSRPEFKQMMRDLGLVEFWRTHEWADKCRPLSSDDFDCGMK